MTNIAGEIEQEVKDAQGDDLDSGMDKNLTNNGILAEVALGWDFLGIPGIRDWNFSFRARSKNLRGFEILVMGIGD